eukprot:188020_1
MITRTKHVILCIGTSILLYFVLLFSSRITDDVDSKIKIISSSIQDSQSVDYFERVSSYTNVHDIYTTEWYNRLSQIDQTFRDSISKPFAKKQSLAQELNQSCLFLFDNIPKWAKGIGNRFLKMNHISIASSYCNCSLSIQWGVSTKCNMTKSDTFNLYNTIFLDNEDIIASNLNPDQSTHFMQTHNQTLSLKACGGSFFRANQGMYPLFQNTKKIQKGFCGWDYRHKATETDKLNAIDKDTQHSIDWRGSFSDHLRYSAIAKFYGTLIYNLKMKYRAIIINFIEKHFKNTFMIGVHLRFGNGEFMNERQQIDYNSTGNMMRLCEEIVDASNIVLSIDQQRRPHSSIGLLVVADEYSVVDHMIYICDDLKAFFKGNILVRPQLATFDAGYGHLFSDEFQQISVERQEKINEYNFGNCDDILGDSVVDSELLGYTDGLLLPHASSFTILSKMMILKRHKILCGKMWVNSLTYQCVYWDLHGETARATTFWKNFTYWNEFNRTAGFGEHWKTIQAKGYQSIPRKEREFFNNNVTTHPEIFAKHLKVYL